MRVIADLHIHSRFSRATSPKMSVKELSKWAKIKGIGLMGTGDFTHPEWLKELKKELKPIGNGLFECEGTRFMLTSEISSIYSKGGKVRKIHNIVFAPGFEEVEQVNEELGKIGNLKADGRPILGLPAPGLVEIVMGASKWCEVVPAHCLPPGTPIKTRSGIKEIEKIKVGDEVYTHNGRWKRVTKKFERHHTGKIFWIRPYYFRMGTKTTPEHPYYAIKTKKNCPSTGGYCKKDCSAKNGCKRKHYEKYRAEWKQARELEKSDVLVYPIERKVRDTPYIELSDYCTNAGKKGGVIFPSNGTRKKEIRNRVRVDRWFCRLMGYYLAEGFTNNRDAIGFCFKNDETRYIAEVIRTMKKSFGVNEPKKECKHNAVQLVFYSKVLVKVFLELFYHGQGRGATSKCLPDWCMILPERKQAEILIGWWRGDTGYTSSRKLMNQMKDILLRLSIIPSILEDSKNRHTKATGHKISGRIITANENNYHFSNLSFFEDEFGLLDEACFKKFKTKMKRRHGWLDKDYAYLPIRDVETKEYDGKVYNLEVEDDNSYVSEFATVHNCWTPWFSVFGANSGFDSMEECFEDQVKHIHALETGLSSDPPMNWRVSALDKYTLISNSDSHSAPKIGREANVFEFAEGWGYKNVVKAIREKDAKRMKMTVEFFPEEGKYHWDGHRKCNVHLKPSEAIKYNNICPVCGKKLTIGVEHRVEELADRPEGYKPKNAIPFIHLIPLQELVAEAIGKGVNTKATFSRYHELIKEFGTEFRVLTEVGKDELYGAAEERVAEAVLKVREGKAKVVPGYDGVYGKIGLFEEKENRKANSSGQKRLGEFLG